MFRIIKRPASQGSLRIPSPPSSDFFYHGHSMLLRRGGGEANMTDIVGRLYKELGSSTIHIKPLPWMNLVYTKDPKVFKALFEMKEDRYPDHFGYMSSTVRFLNKKFRNAPNAFVTSGGQNWLDARTLFNKYFFLPSQLRSYVKGINDILDDYNSLFKNLINNNDGTIYDLKFRNSCLSLEIIAQIFFGQRLGLMRKHLQDYSQLKVGFDGQENLLRFFSHITTFPTWFIRGFEWNKWQHIKLSYLNMQLFAEILVDKWAPSASDNSMLTMIKDSNPNIDNSLLKANLASILLASIHTTSSQLVRIYQLLAENEQVQEKIRQNIIEVMHHRSEVKFEDVERISIARNFLKEAHRLCSISPFLLREIPMNLKIPESGLTIPKGWKILCDNYNLGRDDKLFPDPLKLLPERWMQTKTTKFINFSGFPFGFGKRSCLGQKLFELETQMIIIKVIRNFRIKLVKSTQPILNAGYIPDDSPILKFIPVSNL